MCPTPVTGMRMCSKHATHADVQGTCGDMHTDMHMCSDTSQAYSNKSHESQAYIGQVADMHVWVTHVADTIGLGTHETHVCARRTWQ